MYINSRIPLTESTTHATTLMRILLRSKQDKGKQAKGRIETPAELGEGDATKSL